MSKSTRYRRKAGCGHDYMAVRAQGRRHKLCPCCTARSQIATWMRPCVKCGTELGPHTSATQGGRNRKFCPECDSTRGGLGPRPCVTCGERVSSNDPRHRFCSRPCRERARHPLPPERPCEFSECGEMFQPSNTRHKACSPMHARKAWQERNPERDADVRRDMYHRRRARKKGSTSGAPVIRREIAERDEWTCHLCDEPIPKSAA